MGSFNWFFLIFINLINRLSINEKKLGVLLGDSARIGLNVMWDVYSGCTGWNIEAANYLTSLDKVWIIIIIVLCNNTI